MKFFRIDKWYYACKPGSKLFWVIAVILFSLLQPRLGELGHPPINGEGFPFSEVPFYILYTSWWMSSTFYALWALVASAGATAVILWLCRLCQWIDFLVKKEEHNSNGC